MGHTLKYESLLIDEGLRQKGRTQNILSESCGTKIVKGRRTFLKTKSFNENTF